MLRPFRPLLVGAFAGVTILIAVSILSALPITASPSNLAAPSLPACSTGALAISSIQTPVPVALAPTNTPPPLPSSPSSPTPARPTPTPRPAPATDRVGYPDNYQTAFKLLYVLDRGPAGQVRVVCGNDIAASRTKGDPFPYGSYLAMEIWRAKRDPSGAVVTDNHGRLVRETLTGLIGMRKEPGFGTDFQQWRSGEWEYIGFRPGPDKQYSVRPADTNPCAACHLGGGNTERDWTFFTGLMFTKDQYKFVTPPGPNEIVVSSMAFAPSLLTVQAGTTVKWRFDDVTSHIIVTDDRTINSGTRASPGEFDLTFDKPGTFNYYCAIHPEQMRGQIEVKPHQSD